MSECLAETELPQLSILDLASQLFGMEVLLLPSTQPSTGETAVRIQTPTLDSVWVWFCAPKRSILAATLALHSRLAVDDHGVKIAELQAEIELDGLETYQVYEVDSMEQVGKLGIRKPRDSHERLVSNCLDPLLRKHACKVDLILEIDRSRLFNSSQLALRKILLRTTTQNFYAAMMPVNRSEMVLEVLKEQSMDEVIEGEAQASSPATVKLYLGTLKMDLDTLLNLHPGAQISFPRPVNFQATLELGGGDWAEVEVSFENDQIRLQVQKLCDLERYPL